MGCYYITLELPGRKGEGMIVHLARRSRAGLLAWARSTCTPRSRSACRKWQKLKSEGDERHKPGAIIETTYGRILFNTILPRGHGFLQQAA